MPAQPEPLERPDPDGPEPGRDIAAYPAVQLFDDRARLNRPDFRLDEGNQAHVGQICFIELMRELGAGVRAAAIQALGDQSFDQLAAAGAGLSIGAAHDLAVSASAEAAAP